jgi:hypothetical protein
MQETTETHKQKERGNNTEKRGRERERDHERRGEQGFVLQVDEEAIEEVLRQFDQDDEDPNIVTESRRSRKLNQKHQRNT